jgi:alkyl hydroperoxide reductase subunit F
MLGLGLDLNLNVATKPIKTVDPSVVYDTLVIGAGPAGLNAALYAKRKGLLVGVVAERIGGQVLDTAFVENWLGTNRISGEGLMKTYEDHVREYEVPVTGDVRVEKIINGDIKQLQTSNGTVYQARTLVIATGTMPRKLGVPGEERLTGRGVSYCAICDGSFFAGQNVIVVGGGNAAVGAAIDLARIAKSVHVVQRSAMRADKVLLDRLQAQANVTISLRTQIVEIKGEDTVTGVRLLNTETGTETTEAVDGVFIEIGHNARTDCMKGFIDKDAHGEVIIHEKGETSVPGIFAAGDVTTVPYKQIVIAAAEGAKAALRVNEYINRRTGGIPSPA